MLVFTCSKKDVNQIRMRTVKNELEAEEWIDEVMSKEGVFWATYQDKVSNDAGKCFIDFCRYIAHRLESEGRLNVQRTEKGLQLVSEIKNPGLLLIQEVLNRALV